MKNEIKKQERLEAENVQDISQISELSAIQEIKDQQSNNKINVIRFTNHNKQSDEIPQSKIFSYIR